MSQAVVHLVELIALVAVASSAVVAVGSTCVYPLARARLRRVSPVQRVMRLVVWSAAPLTAAATLVVLSLAPSILTLAGLPLDHCFASPHSHGHLCLLHPPTFSHAALPVIVLRIGIAVLVGAAAWRGLNVWRDVRLVRALRASSRIDASLGVRLVPSERPLSVAAGLFRPEVLVSSGLVRALTHQQVAAVVAHERAHATRHHALLLLMASALTMAHLPWMRRWLLDDLSLACEEESDDLAARDVGSELTVAEAIVAVGRLLGTTLAPGDRFAPAFATHHVTARVERLLHVEPDEIAPRLGILPALVLVSLAAMVALQPVHHLTETLLHRLLSLSS